MPISHVAMAAVPRGWSAQPASVVRLLLFGISAVLIGWGSNGRTAEIPIETLFQRPQFGAARLSPNGRFLAVVNRLKGRSNLEIVDLEARERKAVTSFDDGDVLYFGWINNNRLVLAAGDAEEASGKAVFRGWYAVNRDASDFTQLRGFSSYLGPAPGTGDDIIVTAHWRGDSIHDVFQLNTHTSYYKVLSFDNPDAVVNWVVDRRGVPRLAHSWFKGTHTLWYRESPDAKWTRDRRKQGGLRLALHSAGIRLRQYDAVCLGAARRRQEGHLHLRHQGREAR
jgi:hypothetical protein